MSDTDPIDPSVLPYETPAPPTLRQHASRGFVWMAAQTVGSKAISAVGQIVVARLLLPEAFGVYGLAVTVTVFTAFVSNMGLHQILIQRRNMRRWANAAFWLGMALGIFAALLTAAAAPVAARFYHNNELIGLLLVLSLIWPLVSLAIVPEARLASELRFTAIAKLRWIQGVLAAVVTVLLAALHFGSYSFALSRLAVFVVTVCVLWTIAPVCASPQPADSSLAISRCRRRTADAQRAFLAADSPRRLYDAWPLPRCDSRGDLLFRLQSFGADADGLRGKPRQRHVSSR